MTDSDLCLLLSESNFILKGICHHSNRPVNVNSPTCFCLFCSVLWSQLLRLLPAVILYFSISTDSVRDSWHALPNLRILRYCAILVHMAVSPSLFDRLHIHSLLVRNVHAWHGGRQPKLLGDTGTYGADTYCS